MTCRLHHRTLLRLIGHDVSARPQVIEDACAYAWAELLARQPERTNIIGWLRIVARREAIRLARKDRRLAALRSEQCDLRAAVAESTTTEACEALALLAGLPERKRAALTLQVAGYTHAEIAAQLQMSQRTVERQLLRARAAVRRQHDQGAPAAAPDRPGQRRVGRRPPDIRASTPQRRHPQEEPRRVPFAFNGSLNTSRRQLASAVRGTLPCLDDQAPGLAATRPGLAAESTGLARRASPELW